MCWHMPTCARTCGGEEAEQGGEEEDALDVDERGDLHNVDGLVEEGAREASGRGVVEHRQRHLAMRTRTGSQDPSNPLFTKWNNLTSWTTCVTSVHQAKQRTGTPPLLETCTVCAVWGLHS